MRGSGSMSGTVSRELRRPNGAPAPASTGPNFFLIGAARSGTTALAEMLRRHPDVFVTRPKEPHFLAFAGREVAFTGPSDEATVNQAAVTDPAAYLALYRTVRGEHARGDAAVTSLYYAERSLETLHRRFPDARVVAILRNPVTRAYSAYSYLRVRGFEPCADFLDALAREPERIRLGWQHLWHYVAMGRYARQLEPFFEQLGPERVEVTFYEHLCDEPLEIGRRLFDFLGVDAGVELSCERVNVSGTPRSRAIQSAIRWGTRRPLLRSALKTATPFQLRERVRRTNLAPDELPEAASRMLHELFVDEVRDLRALLAHYVPGLVESAPGWLAGGEAASRGALPA